MGDMLSQKGELLAHHSSDLLPSQSIGRTERQSWATPMVPSAHEFSRSLPRGRALSLTVHLPVQLPVQYARSQFQPPTKGRINGKAMKSLKETILKRDFGSPFENSSRATRIFESLSDYQHVHKVSLFSMNKRIPFFSCLFFLIIEKGLTF